MPRYEKRQKGLCARSYVCFRVFVCKVSVFIWYGVFRLLLKEHTCVPSLFGLTICGLSCTHQEQCATIAKVPTEGAAQRDKTAWQNEGVRSSIEHNQAVVNGLGCWVWDHKSGD